jgi:tripartite-type tricarboxylate transporter receptor subunit TctC
MGMCSLRLLVTLFAVAAWSVDASAQSYPSRPVTIIVPFAPGGLTDVPARLAATMLQEKVGQAFIVENKTGASGTVGGQYAARAEPDGYTLFANSVADTQNLHYMPVSYSAVDDFTQIGFIVEGPALLLVIDAKLPYKTLDELLTEARINPSKVTFGTSGPAASPALSLNQLNALAKTQIVGVPYRGVGEAAQAAAAGIIQGTFVFYSQAKSLAEQGKVRALAIASPTRITTWPEVPTLRELGYDIDGRGFVGLAAPAKTPKPIIAFLNARLNEVVQSDTFKSRMGELGMAPPPDNTPEHLDAFLRGEIAHQGELAKLSGEALKR